MRTVAVGTAKGLFILEQQGPDPATADWGMRGPYLSGWEATTIAMEQREGRLELLAGLGSYVYGPHVRRSLDRGESWEPVGSGPGFSSEDDGPTVARIWTLHRLAGSGELVAGVAQAGLFRWDDRALTWREYTSITDHPTRAGWLPGAGGMCLHTVLTDSRRPGRITVGISSVGTLRSDDDGATWNVKNQGVTAAVEAEEPKYSELNRCVHRLVFDPADPDHLFQQNHTGVYRSFDAGDNWERIESGLPSRFGFGMTALDHSPSTLFVVPLTSDEVRIPLDGRLWAYRSTDYGDSWVACGTGMPLRNYGAVLRDALTTGIGDASSVYFGTTSGELYATWDAGDSWRRLPGVYPRILSVRAIDPE
ncbi:MAG: sialidase family protein [Candidatus Dormiibacterota bacterium]